jgi:hypothetical protein
MDQTSGAYRSTRVSQACWSPSWAEAARPAAGRSSRPGMVLAGVVGAGAAAQPPAAAAPRIAGEVRARAVARTVPDGRACRGFGEPARAGAVAVFAAITCSPSRYPGVSAGDQGWGHALGFARWRPAGPAVAADSHCWRWPGCSPHVTAHRSAHRKSARRCGRRCLPGSVRAGWSGRGLVTGGRGAGPALAWPVAGDGQGGWDCVL